MLYNFTWNLTNLSVRSFVRVDSQIVLKFLSQNETNETSKCMHQDSNNNDIESSHRKIPNFTLVSVTFHFLL